MKKTEMRKMAEMLRKVETYQDECMSENHKAHYGFTLCPFAADALATVIRRLEA
jgi:hypothetical protein